MTSASESWDREYRQGRYRSEPPIPFVDHTIETLGRRPEVRMGRGLYIGCRNGRNYIPLCDAGLAIRLCDRYPGLSAWPRSHGQVDDRQNYRPVEGWWAALRPRQLRLHRGISSARGHRKDRERWIHSQVHGRLEDRTINSFSVAHGVGGHHK